MKLDFSKAKVGDKVYSVTYGNGVIKEILKDGDYSIRVKHYNDEFDVNAYTHEGFYECKDKNPSLFWGNYDSLEEFFKSDKKYQAPWFPKVGELVFTNGDNIALVININYNDIFISRTPIKLNHILIPHKLDELRPIDKERQDLIRNFYGNDKG